MPAHYLDNMEIQWKAKIRMSKIRIIPKARWGPVWILARNFCLKSELGLSRHYALASTVGQVVEISIQTAVLSPDDYKPDASRLSEIRTSLDFGASLYVT